MALRWALPAAVRLAVTALAVATLAGCTATVAGVPGPVAVTDADHRLVERYFAALDAAADRGADVEQDLLRRTQDPDFTDRLCGLAGMTVTFQPAMSSLRPDPAWTPAGAGTHPRGLVLRVAVTVTVRRGQGEVGQQIGLVHVVLLDGAAYGFAPCPNT
jgi:hypothetical protein